MSAISLNDIKVVRGTEPDIVHGGKLVDGVILGPKKNVCRWRIKDETRLFHDREDAKTVVRDRMLSEDLYRAMGFDLSRPRELTAQDVILRLKHNAQAVKDILTQVKYRSTITKEKA